MPLYKKKFRQSLESQSQEKSQDLFVSNRHDETKENKSNNGVVSKEDAEFKNSPKEKAISTAYIGKILNTDVYKNTEESKIENNHTKKTTLNGVLFSQNSQDLFVNNMEISVSSEDTHNQSVSSSNYSVQSDKLFDENNNKQYKNHELENKDNSDVLSDNSLSSSQIKLNSPRTNKAFKEFLSKKKNENLERIRINSFLPMSFNENERNFFSQPEKPKEYDNGPLINKFPSHLSLNDPKVKPEFIEFLKNKKISNNNVTNISKDTNPKEKKLLTPKSSVTNLNSKSERFQLVKTPKGLTKREKLSWLQRQRDVGLYVHCDNCNKLRYLENVNDPTILPEKWYCFENQDEMFNNCSYPQEEIPLWIEEDFICNLYNAGSVVWAKVEGHSWAPAMVDDDPDNECFYWLEDQFNNVPTHYHVTFFAKPVVRAWVKPKYLKAFIRNENFYIPRLKSRNYHKILYEIEQAKEALNMDLISRLKKYSFLARYKGLIKNKSRKYKNTVHKTEEDEKMTRNKKKTKKSNKKDSLQTFSEEIDDIILSLNSQ